MMLEIMSAVANPPIKTTREAWVRGQVDNLLDNDLANHASACEATQHDKERCNQQVAD
jgi:hypothetical protein